MSETGFVNNYLERNCLECVLLETILKECLSFWNYRKFEFNSIYVFKESYESVLYMYTCISLYYKVKFSKDRISEGNKM